MSVLIRCPKCEHSFSVPDKFLGKKGKCPKCSAIFAATAEEVETFPVDDETPVVKPVAATPVAAPPKKAVAPPPKGKVADSTVAPAPAPPLSDSGEIPVFEVVKSKGPKIGVPGGKPESPAPLSDSTPTFPTVAPDRPPVKGVPVGKAESPSLLSDSTPTFPTVSSDKPPARKPSVGATTTVIPKGEPMTVVNPLPALGSAHAPAHSPTVHRPKPPDGMPPWVYAVAVIGVAAIGGAIWFVASRPKPTVANPAPGTGANTNTSNGTPTVPVRPADPVSPGPRTPSPEATPTHTRDEAAIKAVREKLDGALVQLEVIRGGSRHGALGVYVDARGWIATSYDAVMGATQAEIVTEGDKRLPVAGAVAFDFKHGLAILKVNPLEGVTPVAIRSDDPKRGERLFPAAVEAARPALTDTTVLGVMPTARLPFTTKSSVKSDLQDTADLTWIEHLAPLEDRATGGPLVDAEGKLVGISIVLGGAGQKGYAVQAKHLAAAIASATDEVKPLDSTKVAGTPTLTPPDPVKPTPGPSPMPMPENPSQPAGLDELDDLRLQVIRSTMVAKSFQAATADEYKMLTELAQRLLNVAKVAETASLESTKKQAAGIRDATLEELSNFLWPADVSGTNKQAVEAMNAGEKFVFVYAEVKLVKEKEPMLGNRDIVVLQVVGTEKFLFLPIKAGFGELRVGSQWLVVARRDGQPVVVQPNNVMADMIETQYVIGKPAR